MRPRLILLLALAALACNLGPEAGPTPTPTAALPPGFISADAGALGYDAAPIEDPAMVAYFVEGNQLVVAVHPSLLAVDPGAAPDGFVLYVGTARSINALDYFNGEGPLHVPEALVVPDEVVSQVD